MANPDPRIETLEREIATLVEQRQTLRDNLAARPPRAPSGRRLFPLDKFGHDHLWWLDRMVRTAVRCTSG
jgi:hypothetical protein